MVVTGMGNISWAILCKVGYFIPHFWYHYPSTITSSKSFQTTNLCFLLELDCVPPFTTSLSVPLPYCIADIFAADLSSAGESDKPVLGDAIPTTLKNSQKIMRTVYAYCMPYDTERQMFKELKLIKRHMFRELKLQIYAYIYSVPWLEKHSPIPSNWRCFASPLQVHQSSSWSLPSANHDR